MSTDTGGGTHPYMRESSQDSGYECNNSRTQPLPVWVACGVVWGFGCCVAQT